MTISHTLRLLTGVLLLASMSVSEANAQEGKAARQAKRALNQQQKAANQAANQARRDARQDARQARKQGQFNNQQVRRQQRFDNRWNRPSVPVRPLPVTTNRWNDRDRDGIRNRFDRDLDNDGIRNGRDRDIDGDGIRNARDRDRDGDGIRNSRDGRRVAANVRFNNWNDKRRYLNQNLRRFNQIAHLNALQQQQLDAQMRAAYLAYHNNRWNGPYNWDVYSEPQFLDYLQDYQPSLLDRILGYLGVGGGLYGGNLYSNNWDIERDQLSRNLAQIHQLRLQGRISPYQEQQLLDQLRLQFGMYNRGYSGNYGWSTYSNPGFMDYLNTNNPGILTTIRSYLGL